MTLNELFTLLNGVLPSKVAYGQWPEGGAPALPWIVYELDHTENFMADAKVYKVRQRVNILLYSKNKDITTETEIERMLDENSIQWQKFEEYIESEKCYEITYEIRI